MTFGPMHYVPVLKVKDAEKGALAALSDDVAAAMTPLLEIVERTDKPLGAHLDTAFKKLASSVGRFERCLLDAREIAPDRESGARAVFERAAAARIPFTPVIGLTGRADIAAATAHRSKGLAIRLTREEFEGGLVERGLRNFVVANRIEPEETDLVVDLGSVPALVQEGVAALAEAFLAAVPERGRWRTLTVAASAYPLKAIERHSQALAERIEWLAWKASLYEARSRLDRLPTYSDCGIQHPKGVERFDGRTMNPPAVIRYACDGAWLLIKGEGTKGSDEKKPSIQFPKLARQLVGSRRFRGTRHCEGCLGMRAAAHGEKGFGSLGAWRRLGTIHHLTTVAEQLSALPWP